MTTSRLAFGLAFFIALVTWLVMWHTYPLNVGAYDYPNYVRMIAHGTSNLVHASGYTAVLHGFMELLGFDAFEPILLNVRWLGFLQRAQNALHLGLFATVLYLAARIFGVRAAALTALGWGTNVLFLSNVNAAAPEWMQGHLIVLSLLIAAAAWQVSGKKQTATFALAGAVFGLAYLVKYNSLLAAPGVLALALFGSRTWMSRFLHVALALAAAATVVIVYASTYHARSTGTTKLSVDHTWVFTTALPAGYFQRNPENLGTWSLRYAALCALTPPTYGVAGAFPNIDWGAPEHERRAYAPTFDRVMRLSRAELVDVLRTTPLPAAMTNFVSSIPLYYYYGLERTDEFGSRIFLEAFMSDPLRLVRGVFTGLARVTFNPPPPQAVPTFDRPLDATFGRKLDAGFVTLTPAPNLFSPHFAEYYNPAKKVWRPGVELVEFILAARSSKIAYALLNLAAVCGLLVMVRGRAQVQVGLFSLSLLLMVSGSLALIGLRSKEVVAVAPLFFVVWGVGLSELIGSFARWMVHKPAVSAASEPTL
jgi:hypothetical protein